MCNDMKLLGEVLLDISKRFFPQRVVGHWKGSPGNIHGFENPKDISFASLHQTAPPGQGESAEAALNQHFMMKKEVWIEHAASWSAIKGYPPGQNEIADILYLKPDRHVLVPHTVPCNGAAVQHLTL